MVGWVAGLLILDVSKVRRESINLTALTTQKTRAPCTVMFSMSQVSLQLLCDVNKHLLTANEGWMEFRLRNGREANHTRLYKTLCRLILITIWCSKGVFRPPSPISHYRPKLPFAVPLEHVFPCQISQKYVHRQHKRFLVMDKQINRRMESPPHMALSSRAYMDMADGRC
jgi:hypothetical protein